ncbi:MarR family winged helix-turn-helix transcriptional regulator [Umezawaea tangerina]|uniref:MarR family transcriptional regulator n=1 Tax=Umezawaea tangerina TaxID=84725 RepID=A0A2T0SDW7_9PSEU|nr:MarR family winged helix-turn-helix transcriptional regulator [Umezawaea tangerina]PRY31607.1 MarR family transcriptional regulator [Umezawaea tangerina]
MSDDPWLNETEQRAWRSFLAMQRQLSTHLYRHLQREFGLSSSDYEILVILSESPTGRMRAFELGEVTDWEKSRMSHHLTRMAQRGLVRREPCPDDTRYADIVLTDEGRNAITEAAPSHAANVRAWFIEAVGPERLDTLQDAADAVLTTLAKHSDKPTPT